MFAFAGLYDIWLDAEKYPLKSFTIITTQPNVMMETIHNRMPVILDEQFEDAWLDPDLTDVTKLLAMLVPYAAGKMEAYPVRKIVNNPENDTADIIVKSAEEVKIVPPQPKLF